jgi:hypothetical protein
MKHALVIITAAALSACTHRPARLSDAELLRYMPPGATIKHKRISDYGVTYPARFVVLQSNSNTKLPLLWKPSSRSNCH